MNSTSATAGTPGRRRRDPFAALPHYIAGDPKISPLGKAILLALLYWARAKDHCWPADASIAKRIGRSEATVQRGLRHLQDLGLIDRRRTHANRTGRLIVLTWRAVKDEALPTSQVRGPALSIMRDEGNVVIVKGDGLKESGSTPLERQRFQAPAPGPASATPRSLAEALAQIRPAMPTATAVPAAATSRPLAKADSLTGPSREAPEPGARPAGAKSLASTSRLPELPTPQLTPASDLQGTQVPSSASGPIMSGSSVISGLTIAEQARLQEVTEATRRQILRWLALGDDPICLAEVRKLLAPPRPPEPSPSSLSTAELLASLPGRPDRVAYAAGRLAEELEDAKSYHYYRAAAEAVCVRRHPPEALQSAWRQGSSPRAARPARCSRRPGRRRPIGFVEVIGERLALWSSGMLRVRAALPPGLASDRRLRAVRASRGLALEGPAGLSRRVGPRISSLTSMGRFVADGRAVGVMGLQRRAVAPTKAG